MLRVIVVDDEAPVRQWFRFCIERSKKAFKVVGEASNGKEALTQIQEKEPDIVLTDIRMPGLDGLSLLKAIKKSNSNISVAILTSYAEFEYAKEAIINGAEDYILKTEVDEEDIIRILVSIAKKREENLRNKVTLNKLQMQVLDNIINKISSYQLDSKEVNKQLDDAKIELREKNICALAVKFSNKISDIIDKGIIKNKNINNAYYTVHDGNILFIICNIVNSSSKKKDLDTLNKFVNDLGNTYQNYQSIGISNLYADNTNIVRVFYEALEAMNQYFFKKPGITTFYYQLKDKTLDGTIIQKYKRQIFSLLTSGKIKELPELIDELFNYIKKENCGQFYYTIDIFNDVFNMFKNYIKYNNQEHINLPDINKIIYKKNDINVFQLWVNKEVTKIVELIENKSVYDNYSSSIRLAIKYIDENYYSNLTLDIVASTVHLNSDYFSKLFKKETGQNFSKYLVNLRINKAKELIKNTDLKIYEVAEKVGYPNLSYFSRLYKKYTGINPTEHRK